MWQQSIAMLCFTLFGAVCGFLIAQYLDEHVFGQRPWPEAILLLVGLFLGMYLAFLIQIILHEAGHLIFGFLSGYRFGSFRIFSLMWIREDGQLRLRRLSVAGTAGQCLMVPPDRKEGKIPVILYNLGGPLMNLLAGLLFLGLSRLFPEGSVFSALMLFLAGAGILLALLNGIPLRMGIVDNDGSNAFALTKNPEALRSFWIQMQISARLAEGIRLRDMPEAWFSVPSDEAMKNSMLAVLGVFACNRLMDAARFEEADRLMSHLLTLDSGMIGIHRSMLLCDRIYVELITRNRPEVLRGFLDKEQKKFMKAMKNYPSVLRTEYTYALLGEQDTLKAEKIQARFEKYAKAYPYPSDVQAERELMDIAAKISLERL